MLQPYIPVAGTWARGKHLRPDSWFRSGSAFDAELVALGYARHCPKGGFWTGSVGGMSYQRLAPWIDAREAWKVGAVELISHLMVNELNFRRDGGVRIIAHSHGGQVAAIALAEIYRSGVDILYPIHVITIDTPVRVGRWTEMDADYRDALLLATSWTHGYSERGWGSRMRWLGNRFGSRTMPAPARNVEIAGGHSGILNAPEYLPQMVRLLNPGEPA